MTLGSFQEVKSFLGGRSASSEHVEKKRGGGWGSGFEACSEEDKWLEKAATLLAQAQDLRK